MIVRRGRAGVRLSAALLLAAACAVGPATAHAAPSAPDLSLMQNGAECEGVSASVGVSSSEVAVGESVTISASCFPGRTPISGNVITPSGPQALNGTTGADGSYSWTFTAQTEGEHAISLTSGGQQATAGFVVSGGAEEEPTDPPEEEPTDPPEEEPSEPPTEEPTEPEPSDPAEPTDPEPTDPEPTEPEPTQPEEPTAPEDPTDEPADETEEPAEDPTEPADPSQDTEDSSPGAGDEEDSASPSPTTPAPGDGEGQDNAGTGPSASVPTRPESRPASPAPASPAPGSSRGPEDSSGPTSEQEQAAAHAAALTSLFAYGVSGGQMGTSPEQAGDPARAGDAGSAAGDASDADGNEELAETGAEISAAAGLAALSLLGGAGLLWHQRRRTR